jgi:mannose-1-phosphate guanylyltransferase / phosphomannomutase
MRKAIVMAGGQGSRLRPLTLSRPKPMMPVANRPVLAHILDWLRSHGFSEVLMTLHYRADDIQRAFGSGRSLGLKITYRVEDTPLGTAGAVKAAEDWIANEPFLIASGDALTDVDLSGLRRRHEEAGAWLTLGLKWIPEPAAYGVVELDARGAVTRFQEKPGPGRAFSHLANTGIYCVEPQVLQWIPPERTYDWSRDVFPKLLAEGRPLYGEGLDGYWCDIGSIDDYRRGQWDALTGAVRVSLPGRAVRPGVWCGRGVRLAPESMIEGPVLLGAGCRIERGARVMAGSVLGERAIVRSGACIRNAALGAGCEVGPRALVEDCVIGEGTVIGAGSSIREGAVVGGACTVPEGTRLAAGQRWEPEMVLLEASRIAAGAPDPLRRRAIAMEPATDLLAPVTH